MPGLQKQQIPIPFAQGLDTKADPKQIDIGKLSELENGVFNNLGRINKRNGYDRLNNLIQGTNNTITAARTIGTFQGEMLLFDGATAYSYVATLERWANRGAATSCILSSKSIVRNGYAQTNQDSCYNNGIQVHVWEDARGGVYYSVVDKVTGTFIVSDAQLSASGSKPKCIAFERYIIVAFVRSSDFIDFVTISASDPTSQTTTTIVSDLSNTSPVFDLCVSGSRLFYAYINAAASTVSGYLDAGLIASAIVTPAPSAGFAISITGDGSGNVYITYVSADGYALRAYQLNNDLGLTSPITTIDSISVANPCLHITAIDDPAYAGETSHYLDIFYEIYDTNAYNHYIKKAVVHVIDDSVFSPATPVVIARSVGLAGKAFGYEDQSYVVASYDSTLQAGYFILTSSGQVIAKFNDTVGGGLRSAANLAEVNELADGQFEVSGLIKGSLISDGNTVYSLTGVNSVSLDFTSRNVFSSAQLRNNLFVVGGLLQNYDGISVTEHGFLLFPENIVLNGDTSGSIADGTYQYAVAFEWTDNYGQVHRSATSTAQTIVLAGVTNSVDITVPTLRLTSKTGTRDNVRIVIYRTEANKTVFHRITSVATPTLNNTTLNTVTFTDILADADILANDVIYTAGAELDNDCPPACSIAVSYKNRIFLAGLPDRNTIWFSKTGVDGEPVAFSAFLTIKVDDRGGDVTGLGVMDDALIIFKERSIYAIYGEGPNNNGSDFNFSEPQLITTDVGCSNQKSIVIVPDGLMFKSHKGIYLLSRNRQAINIGLPVARYNSQTITSATLVTDKNQVRFVCSDGVALVYDFLYGQWSTFTNHLAVGADYWSNSFCFVKSDGHVYQELEGTFTDGGGTGIKLKLTTGDISLAGVQNFQRVYDIMVLGSYRGNHILQVSIALDFNPSYSQVVQVDTSTLGITEYGDDTPYGSGTPYGGAFSLEQFRIHMAQQTCQSIRVRIEDIQSSNFTEGYSISGLNFAVGIKAGHNKLPATRQFG